MTFAVLFQILLLGIALSMDAFAVAVTDGLIYRDINKKKSFLVAGTFGIMQGLMPLIGFWVIELITILVGAQAGEEAGKILSTIVAYASFILLLLIGLKMLIDAIINIRKPLEEKKTKLFSYKEVILMGFATAIDALATGVALHNGTLSNNETIWLHVLIIILCTFVISLIGVLFGKFFEKIFKGKYEICSIVGGVILMILGILIIVEHYM